MLYHPLVLILQYLVLVIEIKKIRGIFCMKKVTPLLGVTFLIFSFFVFFCLMNDHGAEAPVPAAIASAAATASVITSSL